jgi:hypothetical protein
MDFGCLLWILAGDGTGFLVIGGDFFMVSAIVRPAGLK